MLNDPFRLKSPYVITLTSMVLEAGLKLVELEHIEKIIHLLFLNKEAKLI